MLASMPVCRVIADAQEVRFASAREHACQPAGAGVCQTASAAQAESRKLARERLDYETAIQMEADDQVRAHMCVSSHTLTHTHTHTHYEYIYIHLSFCMLCIYVLKNLMCAIDACSYTGARAHTCKHSRTYPDPRASHPCAVCTFVCLRLSACLPVCVRLCNTCTYVDG